MTREKLNEYLQMDGTLSEINDALGAKALTEHAKERIYQFLMEEDCEDKAFDYLRHEMEAVGPMFTKEADNEKWRTMQNDAFCYLKMIKSLHSTAEKMITQVDGPLKEACEEEFKSLVTTSLQLNALLTANMLAVTKKAQIQAEIFFTLTKSYQEVILTQWECLIDREEIMTCTNADAHWIASNYELAIHTDHLIALECEKSYLRESGFIESKIHLETDSLVNTMRTLCEDQYYLATAVPEFNADTVSGYTADYLIVHDFHYIAFREDIIDSLRNAGRKVQEQFQSCMGLINASFDARRGELDDLREGICEYTQTGVVRGNSERALKIEAEMERFGRDQE